MEGFHEKAPKINFQISKYLKNFYFPELANGYIYYERSCHFFLIPEENN